MTSWVIPNAYGLASFAASAMQSLFVTYYVSLYADVYHLDNAGFLVGESVFLIWNSLNDPLFGYLMRGWSVRRRLPVLSSGGSLWVFSFALFFLLPAGTSPWVIGCHFAGCLLLYDAFLSCVLIVHASLLADISNDPVERAQCVAWSSGWSILGSCSVFGANFFFDPRDAVPFRIFCLVVALAALLALQLSFITLSRTGRVEAAERERGERAILATDDEHLTVGAFVRDVRGQRNFWLFVGVNLLQVFNCHYNSNFLTSSVTRFIGELSRSSVSMLLAAAAVGPHVVVVMLAPMLRQVGVAALLEALFVVKVVVGVLGALLAPNSSGSGLFVLFFLANKIFTEVICRHGNLFVAELIDESVVAAPPRAESRASMYYGAVALLTKPGQALAAVAGWFLVRTVTTDDRLFLCVALLPVACGMLQLALFSRVTRAERRTLKIV